MRYKEKSQVPKIIDVYIANEDDSDFEEFLEKYDENIVDCYTIMSENFLYIEIEKDILYKGEQTIHYYDILLPLDSLFVVFYDDEDYLCVESINGKDLSDKYDLCIKNKL